MPRLFFNAGMIALAVSACGTPFQPALPNGGNADVVVQSGAEFDLRVGQTARIGGTGVTILLREIKNDSRCPTDVQCVWAGNATAVVGLSGPGETGREAMLNSAVEPRSAVVSGYIVRLTRLKPDPRSGTTIRPADYVATIEAARQ